jgi:hypothetical protein
MTPFNSPSTWHRATLVRRAAVLAMLFLLSMPAAAQERRRMGKFWKATVAVLASASVADAASSWNRFEANPLLRGPDGRFRYRGVAIKSALAGGVLAAQLLLSKKDHRAERVAAIVNISAGSVIAATAVRNFRVE